MHVERSTARSMVSSDASSSNDMVLFNYLLFVVVVVDVDDSLYNDNHIMCTRGRRKILDFMNKALHNPKYYDDVASSLGLPVIEQLCD